MSGHERTGWRDREFSEHRRLWGFDVPAVDIDSFGLDDTCNEDQMSFNLVEYDLGMPRVLVEYKHASGQSLDEYLRSANAICMQNLANKASLPFLSVTYWPRTWTMNVRRVNAIAQKVFGRDGMMSERDFVTGLYRQRGRVIPTDVAERLNPKIETIPVLVFGGSG